jgi:DNA-directed RNA polymerase subunit H (RpoH/RPB5)
MNTLDKVLTLETKVTDMQSALGNFQVQAQQVIQILNANMQKQDLVVNRLMSIEQSFAAMAKTMNAIVQELEETKVLNSSSVMKRIRTMDESAEKARVSAMLEHKAIQKAEVITENSMLVTSQIIKKQDGQTEVVAEYRVFELSSPMHDKEVVQKFIGKSVGDVVEITTSDATLCTTILEAYDHVQMSNQEQFFDENNTIETETSVG